MNKKNNKNKSEDKYKYDGHSNPDFIWRDKPYPNNLDFEEMVQLFLKESKERCNGLKIEFINNTQLNKLALKKAKKRDSIQKKKGY